MPELTDLGVLLEDARNARGISKREAARRAGISEGRWRQIVSGIHRAGDAMIPVNPRPSTVASMARAVGVDVNEALRAAGLPATVMAYPETAEGRASAYDATVSVDERVEALVQSIQDHPKIPEHRKRELVRDIRRAEAQRHADLQAVEDEVRRYRSA